tara:strand:+ start:363 stop:977 length:615 start_codon:yes stop_codon:yes gene_type:complete
MDYKDLKDNGWYVESFQMNTKHNGDFPTKYGERPFVPPERTDWFYRLTKFARDPPFEITPAYIRNKVAHSCWANWRTIWDSVNSEFGASLDDHNRGDGQAFFWIDDDEGPTLHSYGHCHVTDRRGPNFHYFGVNEEQGRLVEVLDSFADDPANMSRFCSDVFAWQNKDNSHFLAGGSQPDLFEHMKEYSIKIPGRQIISRELQV